MNKRDLVNEVSKVVDTKKDAQAVVNWIFSPFDKAPGLPDDSEKIKFIELLNVTEGKVIKMAREDQAWWMSEIYLRKGICSEGVFQKEKQFPLWRQAYEYALKSRNNEVIVQSALSLGFDFVEFTASIMEVLEIHMNSIRAICAQDVATSTRLRIMGINLFNFWRQIEFRRLSERDLKAKQLVIDSAKSLEKACFDEERASPVMILLISKLFEFDDPCLEWAQMEAAILDIPIPDGIIKKMGHMKLKSGASD
jgi:hypothetical protein